MSLDGFSSTKDGTANICFCLFKTHATNKPLNSAQYMLPFYGLFIYLSYYLAGNIGILVFLSRLLNIPLIFFLL